MLNKALSSFYSQVAFRSPFVLFYLFNYYFFVWYAGLSLLWPLPLRSTGSGRTGSAAMVHGPSRSAACGIFPDRDTNLCPLHGKADSQPLRHQGSPDSYFLSRLPAQNDISSLGAGGVTGGLLWPLPWPPPPSAPCGRRWEVGHCSGCKKEALLTCPSCSSSLALLTPTGSQRGSLGPAGLAQLPAT